jgi:hypothetical protein
VLAALAHDYGRAVLIEQKEIRAGVKKLLARWHRDDAALRRYWDKRLRRKSRTPWWAAAKAGYQAYPLIRRWSILNRFYS